MRNNNYEESEPGPEPGPEQLIPGQLIPGQGQCCDTPEEPMPLRNLAKDITIESLEHGYIVRVGCQRFASEDAKKMLELIAVYLNNPNEIEKKWLNNEFKLK